MLISQALAHGSSGVESTGGYGPLILQAVATVGILFLVAEGKWRKRKARREAVGE